MYEDEFENVNPEFPQLIDLIREPLLHSFTIKGEPDACLGTCIKRCPKELQSRIAHEYGIELESGKGRKRQLELLAEKIIEGMPRRLEVMPLRCFKIIGDLVVGKADEEEMAGGLELQSTGWVFYYIDNDGKDAIPVVPVEIARKFCQLITEGKSLSARLAYYEIYRNYISAMAGLYGVFEKEWMNTVIELHDTEEDRAEEEKENKTGEKSEVIGNGKPDESLDETLLRLQEEMEIFGMDGEYLFDVDLEEDEEYKKRLEALGDKPYYRPTPEDILFYRDDNVNRHLKEYRLFKQYLRKKVESSRRLKGLLDELSIEVVEELGGMFSISEIVERYKLSFASREDLNEFEQLLRNWENHVRKWNNRGFTNAEMKEHGEEGSWAALDWDFGSIEFKEEIPDPDAPCPCGSGKKYRQCCGRKRH